MTDSSQEPTSFFDATRRFEDLQTSRLAERIRDVTENCSLFTDVLKEVAIREAGLPTGMDEPSQAEMLQFAADIVGTIGLDRYVTIHEYRHDTPEEIAMRVKRTRREVGMSQADFGEATGLGSRFIVNRIEREKIDLSDKHRVRIYQALGIDPLTLDATTRVDR